MYVQSIYFARDILCWRATLHHLFGEKEISDPVEEDLLS